MTHCLYNVNSKTLEYLPDQDIAEADMQLNPMYDPETHAEFEKWLYNPRTSTLIPPPETGPDQTACFINGAWIVKADYRGQTYWDTTTKEAHIIQALGVEPDPSWTDKKPASPWQTWNGDAWENDFEAWLNLVLRPQRDSKMNAFQWRYDRRERELRQGKVPTDDLATMDSYMQALANLPQTLSAIVTPIPWPDEPA